MERAKELFLEYNGRRFFMDHDGVGDEYHSYHISKEMEEEWAKKYILSFLESKMCGKEALRAYSKVVDLLKCDKRDDNWEKCLYYPLKSGHLDDVTILFMLQYSFRLAERAVNFHNFSRKEAESYLQDLDRYFRGVRDRANDGTVTRAADYSPQDFSDPLYVASYLDKLKNEWAGLFQ